MPFRILLSLALISLSACTDNTDTQIQQPNIILFFVDDMGWQDTSVPFWSEVTPFNQRYHTPNMERMAAAGMKFTQAYATPVCSPTRISLMTGMNAVKHRVTNWTLRKDQLQPMETNHETLSFPEWNVNGLTPDSSIQKAVYATTFPQILQDNGYHTIHVGKAHFGAIGTPGENPLNLGFKVNIAGHAAGAPKSYYGTENFGNTPEFENSPWPVPGLDKYHGQDINLTEVLTQEAISAMDSAIGQSQPFFLYMAHYTVHTPIMADYRYFQKYLDQGLDTIEARYASMVEGMDKSLGDLMDYVEEKQLQENTIILFMSDNGGLSAVARGGEKHSHNRPLASGKGSIYEGGIREPMLAQWPGKIPAGSINSNYLIIEDFFPTILQLANIEAYSTIQNIDGISFIQQLSNPIELVQDRALYWHYPNEWGPEGPGIGAFSAIRQGDWKLIYYHLDQSFELFNIKEDIRESQNLASSNSGKLEMLANTLSNYMRASKAQMPSNKQTGAIIPLPIDALEKN